MKLLIITQKVDRNDDVLGFFYRWLEEFAKQCSQVSVIALGVGEYKNLPPKVNVLSLGKPASRGMYVFRLFKYLWQLDRDYDFVFVHMNPIYLVLAGWWFKMRSKKVALWYTHRQVDLKLKIAEVFADVIFSAAPESFRLKTKKVKFVGHGIDLERFSCRNANPERERVLIHVGRITPIKNCDVLIDAFAKLQEQSGFSDLKLEFIGQPSTEQDKAYLVKLKEKITKLDLEGKVIFIGAIANDDMPQKYCRAMISVNLAPTGGVDKAVLESLACSTPAFVSNEAFKEYFSDLADRFMFKYRDFSDLADKLKTWFVSSDQKPVAARLAEMTRMKSGVEELIFKLVESMRALKD